MSTLDTIVIGGGLIGVAIANELAMRGQTVELLEAREGIALETSYANGGLMTPSMTDPWNSPGVINHLLASLFDPNSAMKVRISALPSLLTWGIKFLRSSRAAPHWNATLANYALASYSIRVTRELRERLSLQYEVSTVGTLKVFRSRVAMEGPVAIARKLAEHGLRYRLLDREATLDLESQLAPIGNHIIGSLHFPDDEVGDARLFCLALVQKFLNAGGKVRAGTSVERIETGRSGLLGIRANGALVKCQRVVVAAGNSSARLCRPLGISLPIRPAKGYSLTLYSPDDRAVWPHIAVVDDAMHAAVVPLGSRLRIVGTAEFAGDDYVVRPERVDNLLHLLEALYPRVAASVDRRSVQTWTGLRPMSADGVPFVGATHVRGVYLNAGHGHLGWTLAAGSARLLADLMLGVPPEIDSRPYLPMRNLGVRGGELLSRPVNSA